MSPVNLILLDTETTGLDPITANIIQIAWSIVSSNGEVIKKVDARFTNTVDEVPPECSAINHIIYEDIQGAESIASVMQDIEKDCKDYAVTAMVCHNLPFDASMLTIYKLPKLFSSLEGICTLKLSRYLYPDLTSHSLQFLRYYFKLAVPRDVTPHRADSDVIVLEYLLFKMLKTIDYTTMVGICSKPILIKRFPFGKHKGELLEEIPRSYITWALKLDDLDTDLRYSLNKCIRVKN